MLVWENNLVQCLVHNMWIKEYVDALIVETYVSICCVFVINLAFSYDRINISYAHMF